MDTTDLYLKREVKETILKYLKIFPAVALVGPRQCGKSTMIKKLIQEIGSAVYLDLQDVNDWNKLQEPGLFFESHKNDLICLDEIQLRPNLFSQLRSTIDKNRKNGKFLLLGSASRDLIQHSSESLAGRIGVINLTPFLMQEAMQYKGYKQENYWFRGGFPNSFLAENDEFSSIWIENFIQTFIERDIPQLGFQIPALQLRRLLTMCAHTQGQVLNLSKIGESLGLSHTTIKRYIDLLEQTFITRTLRSYDGNVKKRLVKAPKVYIRDSGLLHRLLQIDNYSELLGNPIFGSSWEGVVIENVISKLTAWEAYYFRTASGDEIDLILKKGNKVIGVECKASLAPTVSKGFWKVKELLNLDECYVIAPITEESYGIGENVNVTSLVDFLKIN
jgi:predicted AAA+ superfamily ATPase